jgi:hypothetical protein
VVVVGVDAGKVSATKLVCCETLAAAAPAAALGAAGDGGPAEPEPVVVFPLAAPAPAVPFPPGNPNSCGWCVTGACPLCPPPCEPGRELANGTPTGPLPTTIAPTTDTAVPAAHSDAIARSRIDRPSGRRAVVLAAVFAAAAATAAAAAGAEAARNAGSAATVSGVSSRPKSGDAKTSSRVLKSSARDQSDTTPPPSLRGNRLSIRGAFRSPLQHSVNCSVAPSLSPYISSSEQ